MFGIIDASFSVTGSFSSGPVLFDTIECAGNEESLLDCSHSSVGNHFCDQYNPAIIAIHCKGITYYICS